MYTDIFTELAITVMYLITLILILFPSRMYVSKFREFIPTVPALIKFFRKLCGYIWERPKYLHITHKYEQNEIAYHNTEILKRLLLCISTWVEETYVTNKTKWLGSYR